MKRILRFYQVVISLKSSAEVLLLHEQEEKFTFLLTLFKVEFAFKPPYIYLLCTHYSQLRLYPSLIKLIKQQGEEGGRESAFCIGRQIPEPPGKPLCTKGDVID